MYAGFYINLKTSTERNETLKQHLASINLSSKYTRIEGVNGREEFHKYPGLPINAGSLGCTLSHKKILKQNLESKQPLHILEDDAILHHLVPKIFAAASQTCEWDLIFTDVYFSLLSMHNFFKLNEQIKKFREKGSVSMVNLFNIPFKSTTSYFVNQKSIKKLYDFFCIDEALQMKTDNYINQLVQEEKLTALVFIPFISTISDHSSTSSIDESYNPNLMSMDLLRRAFYINADLKQLAATAKEYRSNLAITPLVQIYSDTNAVILDSLDKNRNVTVKQN